MPRKKKSDQEPEAIVHTRALLIKQSEELQKLISMEEENAARAHANMLTAHAAYKAVQDALDKLVVKAASSEKPKKGATTKKAKNKKRAKPLSSSMSHVLKRALLTELLSPYHPYSIEDLRKKLGDKFTYQQVWGAVDTLRKLGKVNRVGKGKYMRAVGTAGAQTKSKKKKKQTKHKSTRRQDWMNDVDKLFALYESLTPAQALELVPGEKKPTASAVRGYLRRQHLQGNLKQPKKGVYAGVE